MVQMMQTWDILYEVGNTQIILVFENTTVRMEVKPQMEVTLYKTIYMWIGYPSWR